MYLELMKVVILIVFESSSTKKEETKCSSRIKKRKLKNKT